MLRSLLRLPTSGLTPPGPAEVINIGQLGFKKLQKDVSVLQAELMGAQAHVGQFGAFAGGFSVSRKQKRELRNLIEESADACLLIDPRPGLRIVDANLPLTQATFTKRGRILGEKLFSSFPSNCEGDGVATVFEAYRSCAHGAHAYTIALVRYDMEGQDGLSIECHWRCEYLPILNDAGEVAYILSKLFPL
jgi:hypothetical protein